MKICEHWFVLCLTDDGKMAMATSRVFWTLASAEVYLRQIDPKREPVIVKRQEHERKMRRKLCQE